MDNKHVDEDTGRLKDAAGSVNRAKHLKGDGRVDQAKDSAGDIVDQVADTLIGRGTE